MALLGQKRSDIDFKGGRGHADSPEIEGGRMDLPHRGDPLPPGAPQDPAPTRNVGGKIRGLENKALVKAGQKGLKHPLELGDPRLGVGDQCGGQVKILEATIPGGKGRELHRLSHLEEPVGIGMAGRP